MKTLYGQTFIQANNVALLLEKSTLFKLLVCKSYHFTGLFLIYHISDVFNQEGVWLTVHLNYLKPPST